MARRSPRLSRPSAHREVCIVKLLRNGQCCCRTPQHGSQPVSSLVAARETTRELPQGTTLVVDEREQLSPGRRGVGQKTACANVAAVRSSPRRPLRHPGNSRTSHALQRLTALREQRQHKVTARQTPHARQPTANSDFEAVGLTEDTAVRLASQAQASVASVGSGESIHVESFDSSSTDEKPGLPAIGRGRKRKACQESPASSDAAPAATSPVSNQHWKRKSYQWPKAAHRQRNHKCIAGGDWRSLSGSDDSDVNDLIASEDADKVLSQSDEHRSTRSGRKLRSINEKLDWSDSCSESSQNNSQAFQKRHLVPQRAAKPVGRQHAQSVAEGALAAGEDEDSPLPAKRHRQVSNIIGYEDDWETAAVQAEGSGKGKQSKSQHLQQQLEDESDDSQQAAAGGKRRLSKASSRDIQGDATTPAAKQHQTISSENDDIASSQPRRSNSRHKGIEDGAMQDQPAQPNVADLLAEEGLDPVEENSEAIKLPSRRTSSKAGLCSIKDRMQQNQQRLHAGSKPSHKSSTTLFLRNQVYEWHGDRMTAPSDSDSEDCSSEAASDSQASQQSLDDADTSEHDSDLGDFIVDDDPAAGDRGPDEGGDVEPGPSATAVSALLEEAGMVSSRTDKEHFTIYVEYLVYDLVDNTFAVRVKGNSRLRKHFDVAIRHVEESLAFKRDSCATSSAWMNAVPGFLDKVDTYPGLSSDWAAKESSMEDLHDGMCQACQRSFTAGHASKRLTLKGRPYKQLWQYGFRRVSDAHVRRDLPYKDSGDEDEEQLTGHQELQFAVGRYCCARLQMYHALIHYKHRLRGKLKKHIKHAHSMQQIRKEGADWVKAAKSFLQRQGVIDGLLRQYTALKDLATDYATKVSSSTWRKDQGHLGTEVDRLMYQINSDSEGDEGSDIVPEEDEGSQSDDASAADNGGSPGMDKAKPGGERTEAAGIEQHADEVASCSHPKLGKGEQRQPSKQQESSAGVARSLQHSADRQDRGQAAALETQDLEQTLPYEAAFSSLPSQQTLPYRCASNMQLNSASQTQLAGISMDDLTHAEEVQELLGTANVHATAAQEDAQPGALPTTSMLDSSAALQRSSPGSPVSPNSGSAKKHKQADIREFLSPKALHR